MASSRLWHARVSRNTQGHKFPGYVSAVLSTKPGADTPPGDLTAEQMEAVADWSELFGFGEIRIAHEQNLILPDVHKSHLFALWTRACEQGLGVANAGLLTDIIACPGGPVLCALANARSLPITAAIQARFNDLDFLHDLGDFSLNISGCMNACGHHHIGNIGILGVDKNGMEWYQITVGGAQGKAAALGKGDRPVVQRREMPDVIERIVDTFVDYREVEEHFIDTFSRIGIEPFKEHVYPKRWSGMNNCCDGVPAGAMVQDDHWTLIRDTEGELPAGSSCHWLAGARQENGRTAVWLGQE